MATRLAQGFGEPVEGWANNDFAEYGSRRELCKATWPVLAAGGVATITRAHVMDPVAIALPSGSATATTGTPIGLERSLPAASHAPALYRTIGVRRTTSVGADRL